MKKHVIRNILFIATGVALLCCFAPIDALCQAVTVVSPVTNQSYKIPDPATIQTAADCQAAIAAAETAGKALIADGVAEKNRAETAQTEYAAAEKQKNDYLTAMNNFGKNDVDPYKLDLNNYSASGAKFTQALAKYNSAVKTNNALAAKDRKAATVAALNKQKQQIDTMAANLSKWKTKLDVAKGKLDVKNAALQKQQQKYTAAEQASAAKLKVAKTRLYGTLNQLTISASYANRYKTLLTTKLDTTAPAMTLYFDTPEYKSAVAGLSAQLVSLKGF